MSEYEIITEDTGNGTGQMMLFKVDEPVEVVGFGGEVKVTTEYFIASAAIAPMDGPETYVFPANEEGEVIDWVELPGSKKGVLDPESVAEGFVDEIDNGQVGY